MQKQLLLPLPSATLPFLLSFMLLCSLAKAQAPTNDNCTSAIALTSTPDWSELAGTTQNATQSLPAITCGGSQGSADDDVWYKFTALTNRYVVHVTSTSLLNPIIDVRSGACDGTSIACADETGSGQRESLILTNLTIGNTYYIRVYGYLERGSFNITLIHTPPDNDNCSTPIQLTSSTSCNPTSATTFFQ